MRNVAETDTSYLLLEGLKHRRTVLCCGGGSGNAWPYSNDARPFIFYSVRSHQLVQSQCLSKLRLNFQCYNLQVLSYLIKQTPILTVYIITPYSICTVYPLLTANPPSNPPSVSILDLILLLLLIVLRDVRR